uniref:Uncharacterized protein n=1 Tax=Strongyloides papillosus TaxID=174720 RepID=A0A0N5CIX0_STREA
MSQGLNNDESNFEEMLNKIFFEEGMEAPIKKYTYVTTISNGIFYREYPNVRYSMYIGINSLFEDNCLENLIEKWIKFNCIAKSIQIWNKNLILHQLFLYISKIPTKKIPKGKGCLKQEVVILGNKINAC